MLLAVETVLESGAVPVDVTKEDKLNDVGTGEVETAPDEALTWDVFEGSVEEDFPVETLVVFADEDVVSDTEALLF